MKEDKIKSDVPSGIPLIPRYVCDICREKFLFPSSLTKNKTGKLICEKCLEKQHQQETAV